MKWVSRAEWGAPATSPAATLHTARGAAVHYLGTPYTSRNHGSCAAAVRAVRDSHLKHPTEGYVDIAYNLLVCEHGYVFEGRGVRRRSGANGSSAANTSHYAVCALLGSSGLTAPPREMLIGLRDALDHLQRNGAGPAVTGHRDHRPTACPGDPLYEWVRKGAPRVAAPKSKEDDVPKQRLFSTKDFRLEVPRGEWTLLRFDRRYDGAKWVDRKAEPSFCFGPCFFSASVGVRAKGLVRGQELQLRLSRWREKDGGGFERASSLPIHSPVQDGGGGHFVYSWNGHLTGTRRERLRAEVIHFGDRPIGIDFARAEALYWPA